MNGIPVWTQACSWGLVSGGALVIGAGVAYYVPVGQRIIAAIMAFGSGVLISALAFELMDEAYRTGGFTSTAVGFWQEQPSTRRQTGNCRAGAPSIASARGSSSHPSRKMAAAEWRLQ